jgi:hypothetical protein
MEFIEDAQEIGSTCRSCRGTGYNSATLELHDTFGGQEGWGHYLAQDEADALAEAGRLWELTHQYVPESEARWEWKEPRVRPSAAQVNGWSRRGFGHDAVNRRLCVEARAMRLGTYGLCDTCGGSGEVFH